MKEGLMQAVEYNELYTPKQGVYPIIPYLDKEKDIIWECTSNINNDKTRNIAKVLRSQGFQVIETHIETGFDFLTDEPDFEWNKIISNPPFEHKNKFLKRAYELCYKEHNPPKAFAFLLPLVALGSVGRSKMYAEYGVQYIVLGNRINFLRKKGKKSGNWQETGYICYNMIQEPVKNSFIGFSPLDKEAESYEEYLKRNGGENKC